MKIQYCSDLHLEFPGNEEFMRKNPLKPEGDILILAGDIVPFSIMDEHSGFFDWISFNFNMTYWLPGNHEYYHSDISDRSGFLNEKIIENVILINNNSVHHGDIKIIFTTLWTKISPRNRFEIRQRLSDFHAIKKDGKGFSPDEYNYQHEKALTFLRKELPTDYDQKKIVVTHHVPTLKNYTEKYKGDSLNEAFSVELFNDIEGSNVRYWIFGHHHENVDEFSIGQTKLVTNQLGYVKYGENRNFQSNKLLEI